MTRSLKTLMTGLVDYAGLFPPSKLPMREAVETYTRGLMSEESWMLGRFICPCSRLAEFEQFAKLVMPGTYATSGYQEQADSAEPWRISLLADEGVEAAIEAAHRFNERHDADDSGRAKIDVFEIKVKDLSEIDEALDHLPEDCYAFFEFPISNDCRGFIAALAGEQCAAKIRTGGVTADAFPTAQEISAFLEACNLADVPFKATAGLHHPVRSAHPMTYEPGAKSCTMHGFLNLFLAAALVQAKGIDRQQTEAILMNEEPDAFHASEDVIGVGGFNLTAAEIARARETFALSFGSCSFDEPVDDLRKMGWL